MRVYQVFIFCFLSISLLSQENREPVALADSPNTLFSDDSVFLECKSSDLMLLIPDYHKNGNVKSLKLNNISRSGTVIKDSLLNYLSAKNIQSYDYFYDKSELQPELFVDYLNRFTDDIDFSIDYRDDTIYEYLCYEINFSKNKTLSSRGYIYKGNKHHGEWYIYNKKGSLKTIVNYSFGLKNGKSISFVGNELVYASSEYINGVKHGKSVKYRLFSEDVKLIRSYDKGKLIARFRPEYNTNYNTQKDIIYYGKTVILPMGN